MRKRKSKHVVGIDLDGVVIDHTENRIMLARKFGAELSPMDVHSGKMKSELSKECYDELKWITYNDLDIAISPPALTGAREGIAKLASSDVPFYLISQRKFTYVPLRLLILHGLWPKFFNHNNVYFVQTDKEKDVIAKKLGVNIHIDDKPSVLRVMPSVEQRFLMDPHGAHSRIRKFTRVASWNEFINHLRI